MWNGKILNYCSEDKAIYFFLSDVLFLDLKEMCVKLMCTYMYM